jgi:hypothetical protein
MCLPVCSEENHSFVRGKSQFSRSILFVPTLGIKCSHGGNEWRALLSQAASPTLASGEPYSRKWRALLSQVFSRTLVDAACLLTA